MNQIPFGKRSPFTVPRANIGAMRLPGDEDEAVELGPWFATEPLPATGFADTRFPDGVVDLGAVDEAGEPRWTERPESPSTTHAISRGRTCVNVGPAQDRGRWWTLTP